MRLCDSIAAAKSPAMFAPLLCLFLLAGCATLPNIGSVPGYSRSQDILPSIVGARGRLKPGEVRSVIERLKQKDLPLDNLERRMAAGETIGGSPFTAGNRVRLLVNKPAAYTAMFRAIRDAKNNINIETFRFADDREGNDLADLLMQKAAEGVRVNLIYDSVGSISTPAAFFDNLRNKRVNVLAFNPITPISPLLFLGGCSPVHRDHRKMLIVDGSVAFTGSANITGFYSEIPDGIFKDRKFPWRDTDVEIRGPAAAEFQRLFLNTWERRRGPALAGADYFPRLKPEGRQLVRAVGSSWGEKNRGTYLTYLAAISFATRYIHITNAYFVPNEGMLQALIDAAHRGVDVKIILPSRSDYRLTLYAGRSCYRRLLIAGVKVYERRNVVLHAKTAVIDGVWSTVGSTNMDRWSFLRDNEVNAVILGRNFANRMEAMFERDLEASDEITLGKWELRSLGERIKELLLRPFTYWL